MKRATGIHFHEPLWVRQTADDSKRRLDAGEITPEQHEQEMRDLRDDIYYRNLEYREGRG